MSVLKTPVTSEVRVTGEHRRPPWKHQKAHTYCFTCACTYFSRILESCARCGSRALQHYSSEELTLLSGGRRGSGNGPFAAALP